MNNSNTPTTLDNGLNKRGWTTLKTILKTLLSLFFICPGISFLSDSSIITGMCLIIGGLMIFPVRQNFIEKLVKRPIARRVKYSLIAVLIFIAAINDKSFKASRSINRKKSQMEAKQQTPTTPNNSESKNETTDSIVAGQRQVAEKEAENESDRQDRIKRQFNAWNGAHMKLEFYIKENMNDPESFEHIETTYFDKGDYLVVIMKFRGKNAFGGKVINYVRAKVDLDGNVIKILGAE